MVLKACPYCDGLGYVISYDGDGYASEVACGDCEGTGQLEAEKEGGENVSNQ